MDELKSLNLPDRFTEITPLGQGGMASVCKAFDSERKTHVALKWLLPAIGEAEVEQKRLVREACVGMQLEHENIVQAFDLVTTSDGPVLVMEYVEGKTLRQCMKDGLSQKEGLSLLKQVLAALQEAHGLGIVHRDLKPDNIFVTKNNCAKVGDWGLTKCQADTSGLTKTGLIIGTPKYMAPEQIMGKDFDAAVDMYAFGVMLFEVLTGYSPFKDGDISDLLHSHLGDEPRKLSYFLSGVDEGLECLVSSLLSKKADERPTAKEAVKRLTGNSLAKRKSEPKVLPPSERSESRSITKPLFLLFIVAICGALFLFQRDGREDTKASEKVIKNRRSFEESFARFVSSKERKLPRDLKNLSREVDILIVLEAVLSFAIDLQQHYQSDEKMDTALSKIRMHKIGAVIELLQRRLRPNQPQDEVDELAVTVTRELLTAITAMSHKFGRRAKRGFSDNLGHSIKLVALDREISELTDELYLITTSGLARWVEKGELHPALELLNVYIQNRQDKYDLVLKRCKSLRQRLAEDTWEASPVVVPIYSQLFMVEVDVYDKRLKIEKVFSYARPLRNFIINKLPQLNNTGPDAYSSISATKACEAYQMIFARLFNERSGPKALNLAYEECERFLDQASHKPKMQVFAFNMIFRHAPSNAKQRKELLRLLQENWTKNSFGRLAKLEYSIGEDLILQGQVVDPDGIGQTITLMVVGHAMAPILTTAEKNGHFRCKIPPKLERTLERSICIAYRDHPHNELFVFLARRALTY